MRFLAFLILLVSIDIFSCEEFNLYESNKALQQIPIQDQDSLGICYAYVAALLMDVERIGSGVSPQKQLDPIWIALKYKEVFKPKHQSIEAGYVSEAIKAIDAEGICTKDISEKLIKKFKGKENISDAEFMHIVEKFYEEKKLPENINDPNLISCSKITKADNEILNNISEILHVPRYMISPRYIIDRILHSCQPFLFYKASVDFNKLQKSQCAKCSNKEVEEHVLKNLKRNKPVAIAYCSKVLFDKNFEGVGKENGKTRAQRLNLDKCKNHASVIVGSRKHGQKCQLLLRNTWGDKKYSSWPDCICEVSKGKYEFCKYGDKKLNSVGCWVDAEKLSKNIYMMDHF